MKILLVLFLVFAVGWADPAPRREDHSGDEDVETIVEVHREVHHERGGRSRDHGGRSGHREERKFCPGKISPLYHLFAAGGMDHYYTPLYEDLIYCVVTHAPGWKAGLVPGHVSMTSTDCHCNPNGYKAVEFINGPANTGGRPANKNNRVYVIDRVESEHMQKTGGYQPHGTYFYCSPEKDHCGASVPLYKMVHTIHHFYTTDLAYTKALEAGGWRNEGALCYIWPKTADPEEFIAFNGHAGIAGHVRAAAANVKAMVGN